MDRRSKKAAWLILTTNRCYFKYSLRGNKADMCFAKTFSMVNFLKKNVILYCILFWKQQTCLKRKYARDRIYVKLCTDKVREGCARINTCFNKQLRCLGFTFIWIFHDLLGLEVYNTSLTDGLLDVQWLALIFAPTTPFNFSTFFSTNIWKWNVAVTGISCDEYGTKP